jgi:isopentenyl phosphate kinase
MGAMVYATAPDKVAYTGTCRAGILIGFDENDLPIVVFDMNKPGNLLRVVNGDKVGTLVS